MFKNLIKFLTFFGLFQSSNTFNLHIPLKLDNMITNQNSHVCPEYLEKWTKFLNDDQGEFLIKKIDTD